MAKPLKGHAILLLEDDFFQAREIQTLLEQEGARVIGPTGNAADVPRLLADNRVDAALLDINLGRGVDFSAAQALAREGVPFAFITGYDRGVIPAELDIVPCLEKPATQQRVIGLLGRLL